MAVRASPKQLHSHAGRDVAGDIEDICLPESAERKQGSFPATQAKVFAFAALSRREGISRDDRHLDKPFATA